VRAPDLHGYVCTPWCAGILVCAERALAGNPRRMNVYVCAGRPARAGGSEPAAEPCPCASVRRFHVQSVSNAYELGDMRPPCSPPCPPPGTCLEKLRGGRQLVPRRGQVAYTIVSMGEAGAGACGLTRTCTVVAICHDRATCGFAVTCRAVRTAPSLASGLIRTPTVVPNWHHRMTWSSTEAPTHHWSVPARRTNRTTMVLPNWQNHMNWADALGPSAGVQVSCRRRSPATAPG